MLICAVAILCTACSDDDSKSAGTISLEVKSRIVVPTRTMYSTWEKGDAIGIYGFCGTNLESCNMQYTCTDADSKVSFLPANAEQTLYLPDDGSTRDFIAYYPYNSKVGADGTYHVNVAQQSKPRMLDLMGANRVMNRNKLVPFATFTFQHKLAKLELNIINKELMPAEELQGAKVSISGQYIAATYNIFQNGEVAVAENQEKKVVDLFVNPEGTKAEAILLPCSSLEGMMMTLKLKDGKTFDINPANAEVTSFKSNKFYSYQIKLGKDGVKIDVSVSDWAEGNGEGENMEVQ